MNVEMTVPVVGEIHSPAMLAAGTFTRIVAPETLEALEALTIQPARSVALPSAYPFSVMPAGGVSAIPSGAAVGSIELKKEALTAICAN